MPPSIEPVTLYGLRVRLPFALDREFPSVPALLGELDVERGPFPEAAGPMARLDLDSGHADGLVLETDAHFSRNEPGQLWSLRVAEELRFHWRTGEGVLRFEHERDAAPEHFTFWCVHLALPFLMALEGMAPILHAGAVSHGGSALLFMAPTGTGKSTLVDRFLQRGYELVSDDKVPLVQRGRDWLAVPSHPYHRPYRAAFDMGGLAPAFETELRSVGAAYFLNRQSPGADIAIEPVSGRVAMGLMLENHLFQVSFLKRRGLPLLAAFLRGVPAFSVTLPTDLARLDAVCDAVVGHFAGQVGKARA